MAIPAIPAQGADWSAWAAGLDTEARTIAGKADANDARLTDQRTPTDGSVTNAKVSSSAAINADKLADGTTNKVLTAAERTKLAGLATVATSGAYADLSGKPTVPTPSETVVVGTGTADSAAVMAAFNSMKVGGHATGTLRLVGTFAIDTDLVLDGGYASVTQSANWGSGSTERFVLDASAAVFVPPATSACALTVKGFYGATFKVGFKGGGARRAFTDGAITSGSNQFTSTQVSSAVVGQYVRIEGAGYLGEVPMQATITAIAGTTATLSDTATTTVTGAKGAISSIALHQENLINADTEVYGNGFAGLLHHIDTQNATAKYVTQSTVRSLKALSCGQAQGWKNVQGGVGELIDVWDDNCVDGSVHDNCADISIAHWETYNPSTQTVGLLIAQGQDYNADLSLGDAATEALLKIVGGDLRFFRVRTGGRTSVTAGTGTLDGVKLIEVKSLDLDITSLRSAYGVHVKGGGQNTLRIKQFSQTADTVACYVEAGPSTAAPVIAYEGRVRFTGSQAVYLASSLTGGRFSFLKGTYIDSTINQTGGASLYAIDCQATNVTLDVGGLVQAVKGSGIAGGVNHVNTAKLIGLDQARIGNSGPAKGTLWMSDGTGLLTAIAPGASGQVPTYGSGGTIVPGDRALATLTDVTIGTPADTQVLTYESATSKWKPKSITLPAGGADPAGYVDPAVFNLKAFNFPPFLCTTNKLPVSGKTYLIGIPVPAAITVSTLNVYVWTAGATLTSGQNAMGLYDASGNLLGQTADMTTAFASTGPKQVALGSSVNLAGGAGIQCYIAILATGTTIPGFASIAGGFGNLTNFGMASGVLAQGQTGTTVTSLSSTITLSGVTQAQTVYWGALS